MSVETRELARVIEPGPIPPLIHCYRREMPSWKPLPVALCGYTRPVPPGRGELPEGSETCVVCADIAQRAGI